MRRRRAATVTGKLVVLAVVAALGLYGVHRGYRELSSRPDVKGPGVSDPPGQVGVAWEEGLLSPGGDRLAVRFPGVARGGDEPCGAFYIGLVGATLVGLRVTVITIPNLDGAATGPGAGGSPPGGACGPAGSTPRCAEVRLPYPPDGRPLYDGFGGGFPPVATARPTGPLCDQLLDG